MTSAVVAISSVIAVLGTGQKGTIEPHEPVTALASLVEGADSVSAAVVGAHTSLALNARESRFAETNTVLTHSVIIAVVGTGLNTAVLSAPSSHAAASAIEADTMTSAIRRACAERAVREGVAREAYAFATDTCSVAGAVVVTGLGLDTSNHE